MIATIDDAIALAVAAHKGQVDKQGAPYILHPLRVMLQFTDELDQMVAVLHDVLEDTDVTVDRLHGFEMPVSVVTAVVALTRLKGAETYNKFIERVKKNPIARRVKIADINDNLGRMTPDCEHLRARYVRALVRLHSL